MSISDSDISSPTVTIVIGATEIVTKIDYEIFTELAKLINKVVRARHQQCQLAIESVETEIKRIFSIFTSLSGLFDAEV